MEAKINGLTLAEFKDAKRDPRTQGRSDLAVREELDALRDQIDDLIDWIEEVEHDADTANECKRILCAAIGRRERTDEEVEKAAFDLRRKAEAIALSERTARGETTEADVLEFLRGGKP